MTTEPITRRRAALALARGRPFDAGQESYDYSLQLALGVERFFESRNR